MPNDGGPRQPGGPERAAEPTTEPGRMTPAAPGGDSEALSIVAAQPDSDTGTKEQQGTNAAVLVVLLEGGLTIDVRGEDGKFQEKHIGRAVDILLAQGALTEGMARDLKTIYEAGVARLGAAEQSTEHKSILKAIQRGSRETLYDTSSGKQERNEDYGDFFCDINLRKKTIKVSIIEAIAWLECEGHLRPQIANHLRVACRENMRQMPYRKNIKGPLRPEEIEKELECLDEKAREIIDPTNDIVKIADLEEQLNDGDFTLHVDWPGRNSENVDFLTGIFHYRQNGELNTGPAIRLAKKYINELLKGRHGHDDIIKKVEWIYNAELINHDELCQLLGRIITDPDELEQRIASAADLSLDDDDDDGTKVKDAVGQPAAPDGQPVPVAFVDTRQAEVEGVRLPDGSSGSFEAVPMRPRLSWINRHPEISRLITGRRLALAAAGLLLAIVAGEIAIIANKRPNSPDADAQAGIMAIETGGEPDREPQAIDPAKRASASETSTSGEGKAAAEKEDPAPAPENATLQATATPTQQQTQPDLAGAPPLVPLIRTPQSITVSVTIKPSASESGFKIDINASRTQWESAGYTVSVSMGLNGKIIRLTDSRGNIYEAVTESLTANAATLQATLRSTE